MPWDNSPEARRRSDAIYRDKTYQANRAVIMRQAAGRCEQCGRHARLQCDHIIPVSRGGTHHLTNLQALCASCHAKKTGEQNTWRALSSPPGDPDPTPRTTWT